MLSLNINMDGVTRAIWRFGWSPAPKYALLVGMAVLGLLLLRHPAGLALGLLSLIPLVEGGHPN